MELVQGTRKASMFAQEDVFTSMPDNVITNIMNRLPIQDAVKTSILSRNWRFKWTLLSQLVFDDKFFEYILGPEAGINFFDRRNISRLLLHLNSVITKFVLYIPDCNKLDVEDINHWVLFLSKIGIKELTLINAREQVLKLPTHIFSCLELKHLKLHNSLFRLLPGFCGFPNLLSLDLYGVRFEKYKFGELIAQCPLLEILKISDHEPRGEVKLTDIAKLENLKMLSLSLCLINNMKMIEIFQQMGLLLKLQELNLDFRMCKFLAESGAKKRVSTTFPCLKTLTLYRIDFSSDIMVSYAFRMIWSSPNLETLKITVRATYKNVAPPPTISSSDVDCSTMGRLQLQNVVLASIRGLENEVRLIKSLLLCSPVLKKIVIHPNTSLVLDGGNGKFKFASKLLKLHRASPIAEIVLYSF